MSDDPSEGPDGPGSGQEPEPLTPETTRASPVPASEGLADALEKPDASATEAYHQRARLAEDRLTEVLAAYRALKAETEAHRDRITRNVERRFEGRRERLLLKFIDILDNMDRALEAAETSYAGEPMIEGLILVRTQLLQTLQEEGLERIPVIGLAYDPNFSEAVETREVDDPDHNGVVVKELLRGYRLNGRIARASKVVVGAYREGATQAQAPPPEPIGVAPRDSHPSGEDGPSLDDIIARASAREALFPDAFASPPNEPATEATITPVDAEPDSDDPTG